jgi:CIC family chloride channel protein
MFRKMNFSNKRLQQAFFSYFRILNWDEVKLVLQILIVSILVWGVCILLRLSVHHAIEVLFEFLNHVPIGLVFLPLLLGALATAFLAKTHASTILYQDVHNKIHPLPDIEGDGLERAIALYFTSEPDLAHELTGVVGTQQRWALPTFSLALRKWLGTFFTLGFGGSGGLEASVAMIGENLAAGIFKPNRWNQFLMRWLMIDDPDELQTLQMAGISAAICALLHAPFASAFFAVEVMYRRRPNIEKLLFACVASLTAFLLTNLTKAPASVFTVQLFNRPTFNFPMIAIIAVQTVLIVISARFFGTARQKVRDWLKRQIPNHWLRHVSGALISASIALLAVLFARTFLAPSSPEWHAKGFEMVLGPGEQMIDFALAGEISLGIALLALLAKMLATMATLGGGGSAGLLIPSLFIGTMIASAFSKLSGQPAIWLIAPAMTASLVAIVNVPLAAILVVAELFGTAYIPAALVALICAGLFSHGYSIYRSQRDFNRQREIVPGYSVKRILVQPEWAGKSLAELELRKKYGFNVIGFLANDSEADLHEQIQISTDVHTPLKEHDILVVIGKNADLLQFSSNVLDNVTSNTPTKK